MVLRPLTLACPTVAAVIIWVWFGLSFVGQFAAMYVWYTANRGTMHDSRRRWMIPYCLVAYVLISIVTGVGLIVTLEEDALRSCERRFDEKSDGMSTLMTVVVVWQLVDMVLCVLITCLLYTVSWNCLLYTSPSPRDS